VTSAFAPKTAPFQIRKGRFTSIHTMLEAKLLRERVAELAESKCATRITVEHDCQ